MGGTAEIETSGEDIEIIITDKIDPDLILSIFERIPEFNQNLTRKEVIYRLSDNSAQLYLACLKGKTVGFKVGYDRFKDGSYYYWLGGVLPEYRRRGIAGLLLESMESKAKEKNFEYLVVKSRNRFPEMIQFLLANGFTIRDVEPRDKIEDYRLLFRKKI
ncbi:MAG: GNAT family N-acetyltransferase [Candidatus Cloacimonetes bacterium]|nr:GNAT family N-acetyltransferase [Candidatus Cloacimonadota bacterium]